MEIERGVYYAQAANCRLMIQIGMTCFWFGKGAGGYAMRIELFTPDHWFRFRSRIKPENMRHGDRRY